MFNDRYAPCVSRLSSSGSCDGSNDAPTNHAESYFKRRENRLSARKKAEEESANNDYKKVSITVCASVFYEFKFQHKLPEIQTSLVFFFSYSKPSRNDQ